MSTQTMDSQFRFLIEVEKLKVVYRQCSVIDKSRQENSAEHSWHIMLMAIVLQEYANEKIDLLKVIKMLMVHDLVEIDTDDVFVYDTTKRDMMFEKEKAAAQRIFGFLPKEQEKEFMRLWLEFETEDTPESKFAKALDRIQPMLLNYYTDGGAWKKHGITKQQVIDRNKHIEDGASELWQKAKGLIESALEKGYLK